MAVNIAFYVHHHGSGHLMRTLQIINELKNHPVILMGSGLSKLKDLPKHVSLVHLPLDIQTSGEKGIDEENPPTDFHYAPLGIRGIRERVLIMTEVFAKAYPLILIVDVSVEVSMIARLAGIPTIIMRQHGNRTDPAHELAYRSAELLIAPFSKSMYIGKKDDAYRKTFFAGGFSRFDNINVPDIVDKKMVCILVGQGGTSLNTKIIEYIAQCCPTYCFHIIGLKESNNSNITNVTFHGKIDNPIHLVSKANIIIGNTGHNTVMEVAALKKRFIGIPENRPFDEQVSKGESIRHITGVKIIYPNQLLSANWHSLITGLQAQTVDWQGIIDSNAVKEISKKISSIAKKLFPAINT